jgi:hypothetical protein
MTSKDIIEAYLDRDIYEAAGERTLQKIVNVETRRENLTDSQRQLLLALIHRRHEDRQMDRVRRSINDTEFASIVDSEFSIDSMNSDRETEVIEFISSLQKINNSLDDKIRALEAAKAKQLKKTSQHTRKLFNAEGQSPMKTVEDVATITQEIHAFNASATK